MPHCRICLLVAGGREEVGGIRPDALILGQSEAQDPGAGRDGALAQERDARSTGASYSPAFAWICSLASRKV